MQMPIGFFEENRSKRCSEAHPSSQQSLQIRENLEVAGACRNRRSLATVLERQRKSRKAGTTRQLLDLRVWRGTGRRLRLQPFCNRRACPRRFKHGHLRKAEPLRRCRAARSRVSVRSGRFRITEVAIGARTGDSTLEFLIRAEAPTQLTTVLRRVDHGCRTAIRIGSPSVVSPAPLTGRFSALIAAIKALPAAAALSA